MKYLLDTNAISDYLRGNAGVVKKVANCHPEDLAISAVTALELRYGVARRNSKKLTEAVDTLLNEVTILPFSAEAADQGGRLKALLESKGVAFSLADTQIAAQAIVMHLTLVSNDAVFKHIKSLTRVDWRSG